MQRREAREFLLRALYQREFVDAPIDEMLADINPGDQRAYIESAFFGLLAHKDEIDALAASHTVGWRFERLALIDRNILRLGIYELLYSPDIPPEVAIDEAIELCKAYGTDQSRSYVNGILDRIWKEARPSSPQADR